jgi:hypothetical protein
MVSLRLHADSLGSIAYRCICILDSANALVWPHGVPIQSYRLVATRSFPARDLRGSRARRRL